MFAKSVKIPLFATPIWGFDMPEVQTTVGVEAKPGRLLAFPSSLRHGVKPNYTDEERASLSLNVMLPDYVTGTPSRSGRASIGAASASDR